MSDTRLEVWGDPIAHSKSPVLHAAAYAQLGLDWSFERRRVPAGELRSIVDGLDDRWRGLAVTMPLKEEAFRAADSVDRFARLTGAVNTLLLGSTRRGFNTDVVGLVDAFRENGVDGIGNARILGAGATAASSVIALAELGATRIDVRARRPERAAHLLRIGEELGVEVTASDLSAPVGPVDATVATLPSGTALDAATAEALATGGGVLLDAAYAPWPSALASSWNGAPVISGLLMLLHQAVRQVRIFTSGEPEEALPGEEAVVEVMRTALMGD
nr:shikimate dehydrogenase [Microbacterium sp. NIBRBAC000506063]